MTFEDLNLSKPLLGALSELGFTTPTTIQQKVFSVVMSGQDVCGIAQTGTGKTLAYLLPALRQFQFTKERLPQLLIIVPTRELVVQVVETAQQLNSQMGLSIVGVYGGVNMKPQVAEIQKGLDVLVATPGRLIDLLLNNTFKTKGIKRIVIDEIDEMLNLGFRTQLKNILDLLPQRRQNLLFSATLTQDVEQLMKAYFTNPVKVEAAPAGTPLENISQSGYLVPNFYTKVNLLKLLLSEDPEMNKVLVFVSTKQLADQLHEELSMRFRDEVGVIHSNKSQNHRLATVRGFQDGTYPILIATDIIARGLDVAEVSHVINFDLPEQPENYIHRIGRTGRADKKGIAISFVTEAAKVELEAIEELMNFRITFYDLPKHLEISEVLTYDEQPKVKMKNILVKPPKREAGGAAFHEKAAKNQKVNVRRNYEEEKRLKYGRPIKRSGKK
jgi:ATP-dependent RNA helicase RhlE